MLIQLEYSGDVNTSKEKWIHSTVQVSVTEDMWNPLGCICFCALMSIQIKPKVAAIYVF